MAQPLAFLQILPSEIRNHIFRYVVGSPSGIITLSKVSYRRSPVRYKICTADAENAEVISLAFLRSCKQIYEESKDLLWKWNTLDIEELKHQHTREGNSIAGLYESLTSKVQNLQMDADFICRQEAVANQELHAGLEVTRNFRELSKWKNLKQLTVVLRDKFDKKDPVNFSHDKFKRLLEMRNEGEKLGAEPILEATEFQLLYKLCLLSFVRAFRSYQTSPVVVPTPLSLAHIKRNLVINTGETIIEKGLPMRFIKPDEGDPNTMLRELHTAFGGSLWFDGKLLYEKGIKLGEAFTLMPHPQDFIADPLSSSWSRSRWYYTQDLERIVEERVLFRSKQKTITDPDPFLEAGEA